MTDRRLQLVSDLTAAIGREIEIRDPHAAIPWPNLPDVRSMVGHIGVIHRWVTEVVRSRGPVPRGAAAPPTGAMRAWYDEGSTALLDVLGAAPADEPCWIIGDRTGTVAFWRRRMVYEHAKHLMDLRASGSARWAAAPELTPADYADGIDELLSEFLPRSRAGLGPLPNPVLLDAVDLDRRWRIGPRWETDAERRPDEVVTSVLAGTSDLALALWERADLLDAQRFRVEGDRRTVEALAAARIHPW